MGLFPAGSVADSEYLLTRSTTEATLAVRARTEQAAAAHRKIASCYLAKLFDAQSTASIDNTAPIRPAPPDARVVFRSPDFRSPDLRFADLRSVPENEDLTRLLLNIR